MPRLSRIYARLDSPDYTRVEASEALSTLPVLRTDRQDQIIEDLKVVGLIEFAEEFNINPQALHDLSGGFQMTYEQLHDFLFGGAQAN